ncbi:hypothetical protein Ga0100231_012610 [Opitutaceae bacterium TAV4]|uniref:hypothetical protein n=1 Tax=Geminisphaera colitermitum TaxID=1148786 RepID=UPI0001965211|nr:hypothetical protein [Geminisphaera colitermitum]RRJ95029.1 hypothetical protein Ga0100231_012610 [Opitutaceae bacterium TAV4]RRJ99284.1 hypothetical protein Ga0100230_013895 [Opitutaceae bacterium TAV3]
MQNPSSDCIPPTHMAIIAAVVSATMGRQSRVFSVTPAHDKVEATRQWAAEGRRDIFASRRVR